MALPPTIQLQLRMVRGPRKIVVHGMEIQLGQDEEIACLVLIICMEKLILSEEILSMCPDTTSFIRLRQIMMSQVDITISGDLI